MSLNHQELTAVVHRRKGHHGHRNEVYPLRKLVQVSLSIPSSPPTGASFDQFQVDLTSGELLRSGVRVPIQGHPLQGRGKSRYPQRIAPGTNSRARPPRSGDCD